MRELLNKITQGDCLEVLRKMDDECVDLTVTSPPYDNLRTYNGFTFDFEGIASELLRVTKSGGVVVWVVGDATVKGSETGTSFRQALYFKDIGFNLHDTMIYEKTSFSNPCHNRYHQTFEYMFILSKGAPKTFNPIHDRKNKYFGKTVPSTVREADGSLSRRSPKLINEYGKRFNVWLLDTARRDAAKYKHPAMFPQKLANDHIVSWSNPGDVVLDIFGGSGTTAKMALLNERNFIHIDISEEYCEIANKRITEALNKH